MKNYSTIVTTLCGMLASSLLTGAGFWLMIGAEKVSRSEMVDYVERERLDVQKDIASNAKDIATLSRQIEKLLSAQQELLVEQKVLVTKVQQLILK